MGTIHLNTYKMYTNTSQSLPGGPFGGGGINHTKTLSAYIININFCFMFYLFIYKKAIFMNKQKL